jgi:ubiquinone/menaquinone biosynthesis C-methylase UbiE
MQEYRNDLNAIRSHYERYNERERLSTHLGQLEFTRSREIIVRYLPKPPAVALDIGGAVGRYSCWLASKGYEVHLVDPVPALVEQAEEASREQSDNPISSCRVGDARELGFPDSTADAILMLGPLYHLVHRADRLIALREAYRAMKAGGHLFAAGISRFASAIDGLAQGFIHDPEFRKILERDLKEGQHRNHTKNLTYFTDAYFHLPGELETEVVETGFECVSMVAVDGLAGMLQNFDYHWEDEVHREALLHLLRSIEGEPSILGASPHIMCVARKR